MTKEIKFDIINAHELDKNKTYIIEIPRSSYTGNDAVGISKILKEMGVKSLVCMPGCDYDTIKVKEVI